MITLRKPQPRESKPEAPEKAARRARLAESRRRHEEGEIRPRHVTPAHAAAAGFAVRGPGPTYRDRVEIVDVRDLEDLGVRETQLPGRRPLRHRWFNAPDGSAYQVIGELLVFQLDNRQLTDEITIRVHERIPAHAEEDGRGRRMARLDEVRERYLRARIWPPGSFEVA